LEESLLLKRGETKLKTEKKKGSKPEGNGVTGITRQTGAADYQNS